MAVLTQGLMGPASGKVGPIVGGKWKSINYVRGYVVPENPNTAAQQAVRAKFAQLVSTARTLLSTILQPFWDPFYTSMSGFNAWISKNYSLSDSTGILDETAIMAKGTLEPTALASVTYDSVTGNLVYTWNATPSGNGDLYDSVKLVLYDKSTGETFASSGAIVRGDGSDGFSVATGLTVSNLFGYIFLYRGTGSEMIVSDSDGSTVSAA